MPEPAPESTPPDDTTAPETAEHVSSHASEHAAGDLRDKAAEAVLKYFGHDRAGRNETSERMAKSIADAVLAVLTEDTGDLRERLVETLRTALREWDALRIDGTPGVQKRDFLAAAVLPVVAAETARLTAQVAAIRTLITEDYGENYGDEDVPAAVERLMRHLSEHEANVQRLRQSKNEALGRAEAQVAALQRELESVRFDLKVARSELAKADAENNAAGKRAEQAEAERDAFRSAIEGALKIYAEHVQVTSRALSHPSCSTCAMGSALSRDFAAALEIRRLAQATTEETNDG